MPEKKIEGPGCALVTGSARGIGAAIVRALAATSDAARNLSRNVSAQLTLEVMLLAIKEAL